jgi:hypothetical protein
MAGGASISANFEERSMNSELGSRVRGAMTKMAAAVALVGLTQTGMAAPANATSSVAGPLAVSLGQFSSDAPTGPDDPLCVQMPTDPVCEGGPYWQGPPPPPPPPGPPTGPLDPSCISNPADAACMGSPFLPPPPPPPPIEMAPPPPPIEAPPPPPVEMPISPPPMEMPISPPPIAMPSAGMGGMPGSI